MTAGRAFAAQRGSASFANSYDETCTALWTVRIRMSELEFSHESISGVRLVYR